MTGTDTRSKHFRGHLREYNAAFSFTSLQYTRDDRPTANSPGIQVFQIHGELYHRNGPLTPSPGQLPHYAQLFLYDPTYATEVRQMLNLSLDFGIFSAISSALFEMNPFNQLYKTAKERLEGFEQENPDDQAHIILNPRLELILEAGVDRRRHNLPTSNEIAMIVQDEYEDAGPSNIILAQRGLNGDRRLTIINSNNAAYMPLHYVLLFPHGDLGGIGH